MTDTKRIDAAGLAAFDVHVHIEHTEDATATDAASAKYFGESGAARDRASIAEYYRSRRMACVVFSVVSSSFADDAPTRHTRTWLAVG